MKLHNVQLQKTIDDMFVKSSECQNKDDVMKVAEMAQSFEGKFQFDNSENWKIAGIVFLFIVSLFVLQAYVAIEQPWIVYLLFALKGIAVITIYVNLKKIRTRSKLISELSDLLFHQYLFFANHIQPWRDENNLVGNRLKHFAEFERGNYSQEITAEHASTDSSPVPFNVYEFKYVDKEKITKRVSDGKGGYKTEVEYEFHTYFRYGLMFNLASFNNLHLRFSGKLAYPKIAYKPSSIEFNEIYQLGATEEFQMSKFLKPALVEKVVKMAQDFGAFNIEINSEGYICFGFLTNIAFGEKRVASLEQPAEFIQSLENCKSFTRLHEFIELFQHIQRYSD